MKVREVIKALQSENPEAEVRYAYPSKDYVQTTLAGEVGYVGDGLVTPSAYHGVAKVVQEVPADDDGEDTPYQVVLLADCAETVQD